MAAQSRNNAEQVAENDVPLPVKMYNCPHCDQSFYNWQALAGHCKDHKRNQSSQAQQPRRRKPENIIPAGPGMQQQEHQTVLSQFPNLDQRQFVYNQNPQYHLYQQAYTPPQFPAFYAPFTDSISFTTTPIDRTVNNSGRGSASNGKGAAGEDKDNEELDLTLHL